MVAEPITAAHQDDMLRLLTDPLVAATLGGPPSPARVAAMIAAQSAQFDRFGYGFWVWRDKAGGDVVARGADEVEVGWAVASSRWREGLATELGAASVREAFEAHGLDDLVAFTLTDNVASRRVMEKLGMAYERDVVHAGLPHVLYRLRR
jgi:RimJ/RimL family protein N-acetyltransferase